MRRQNRFMKAVVIIVIATMLVSTLMLGISSFF